MAIYTNVIIKGNSYGLMAGPKDNPKFARVGQLPKLLAICETLEDDYVYFKIGTSYQGKSKTAYIERGDLTDQKICKRLADLGFDVTKEHFDLFVDAVRLQEDWQTVPVIPAYSSLGWIQVPGEDPQTGTPTIFTFFRGAKLIGGNPDALYLGELDIGEYGDYAVWRDMVVNDVIPYPTLQLVLIAALSAVVVGALSLVMPIENPIAHLNLPSGRGKTTTGDVAASTIGRPFEGKRNIIDEDGKIVKKHSLLQSWGATENAMIATQAGNCGAVVVLNELGKNLSKNLTQLVFNLSEGSDKKRLTTTLKQRMSESYATTFISTGESSLLDKCTTKLEGLAIRVMEITTPLTESAEHSNRIKKCCFENGGFAAPMLAEYILKNGGIEALQQSYLEQVESLKERFQSTPNKERFIEKFAALFVVTAEYASKALSIDFDVYGLMQYLEDYDREHGNERNVAANSAEEVIEHCRVNASKFFVRSDSKAKSIPEDYPSVPHSECWGRITNMSKKMADGRYVVQEFEIRKLVLEEMLLSLGYDNRSTCITAWKELGVLDFEDATHACRERKIDPTAAKGNTEKVYVLRVFASDEEAEKLHQEELEKQKALEKKLGKKKLSILEEDE